MLATIPSMFLAGLPGDGSAGNEAQLLIDTIESLQRPVEDFQCEFEGTGRYKGKGTEKLKLGEDGLAESFSGMFTWKRGGDFRCDGLYRRVSDNLIERRTTIVRLREDQAEDYRRFNDAPIGRSTILSARRQVLNHLSLSSPRGMFVIDDLKNDVANEFHAASVRDDQIDGRPLKVVDILFKDLNQVFRRYWIDLRRNGHVVRADLYRKGEKLLLRFDIKLAPFKMGNTEVWMPVSADYVGYATTDDGGVTNEPGAFQTLYVVNGTMEFNKHPGPEVFTVKYKPGTPISDNVRKLTYEFGQQKIAATPTRAEAEEMLKEQLAQAEQQKSELAVASLPESVAWSTMLAWVFGALVVISLLVLWIRRRGQ